MRMITEYIEHALTFERLAAEVQNPKLKADLVGQARAYRKLAAEPGRKLDLRRRALAEIRGMPGITFKKWQSTALQMSAQIIIGRYACCVQGPLMPIPPARAAVLVQSVLRRDYDLLID